MLKISWIKIQWKKELTVTLFNDHVLLKKGKVNEFSIIMQQLD
jgi:hypothetical protein